MKPPLKNYLSTTHQERKSTLILIAILIMVMILYLYVHWNPPVPSYSVESIQPTDINNADSTTFTQAISHTDHSDELVPFNPNEVSSDDLVSFGIPAKVASTWIHFLTKGGKFVYPADVKKVYGMNEALYDRIRPFIQFNQDTSAMPREVESNPTLKLIHPVNPNVAQYDDFIQLGMPAKIAHTLIRYRTSGKKFISSSDLLKIYGMNDSIMTAITPFLIFPDENSINNRSATGSNEPEYPERAVAPIDLNLADTGILKRLPGLGHILAARIIAYRERLGGFYTIDQLKEVYGLRDTSIVKFQSRLMVSAPYRKIKINQDSLTTLYHPYLTKKDALLIQNFRNQHGSFRSATDLYQLKAFDPKYWERITPYLDFNAEQ
jgi:DNA uptake protein ComE-like DNA-binding protein